MAMNDREVPGLVLRLTQRHLDMQRRLFGPHVKRVGPVSDAGMGSVLRDVRAASELQSFRIWLVGSRVQSGTVGSDIDLVLSPRAGIHPSDPLIEQALLYCREYGLYGATPPCVIDPSFRGCGPTLALIPLRQRAVINTIKLLSPRLADLVRRGRIQECRHLGEVSLEFLRRAEDTDYYGKLPNGLFEGSLCPYLRPAIEIPFADSRDVSHTISASGR